MANVTYEELNRLYQECSESENKPDLIYGSINDLRVIFGDDEVNAMIARGDIRIVKIDDDLEVLCATS